MSKKNVSYLNINKERFVEDFFIKSYLDGRHRDLLKNSMHCHDSFLKESILIIYNKNQKEILEGFDFLLNHISKHGISYPSCGLSWRLDVDEDNPLETDDSNPPFSHAKWCSIINANLTISKPVVTFDKGAKVSSTGKFNVPEHKRSKTKKITILAPETELIENKTHTTLSYNLLVQDMMYICNDIFRSFWIISVAKYTENLEIKHTQIKKEQKKLSTKLTQIKKEQKEKDLEIEKLKKSNFLKQDTKQLSMFREVEHAPEVHVKSKYGLIFSHNNKIRESYKGSLDNILSTGKTVKEHLDFLDNFRVNIDSKSLVYWLKVFSYIAGWIECIETYLTDTDKPPMKTQDGMFSTENGDFISYNTGKMVIRIKLTKDFYKHFIPKNENTGQYTSKQKKSFLQWFTENQTQLEFPILTNTNNEIKLFKPYQIIEGGTKTMTLLIDPRFLEKEFLEKYYTYDVSILDNISNQWKEYIKTNSGFKKYQLSSFLNVPILIFWIFLEIYNKKSNYETKNFKGNKQKLSDKNLNLRLGNLKDRIEKHLITIKAGAGEEKKEGLYRKILEFSFEILKKEKMLLSVPKLDSNNNYTFNFNPAFFATKDTATRLAPQLT